MTVYDSCSVSYNHATWSEPSGLPRPIPCTTSGGTQVRFGVSVESVVTRLQEDLDGRPQWLVSVVGKVLERDTGHLEGLGSGILAFPGTWPEAKAIREALLRFLKHENRRIDPGFAGPAGQRSTRPAPGERVRNLVGMMRISYGPAPAQTLRKLMEERDEVQS